MDMDKLNKWLELAQQYQSDSFWKTVFDEKNTAAPINRTTATHGFNSQEMLPQCDLFEKDGYLVLAAELPGFKKEEIQISIHQQILTINGEFKTLVQNQKYFLKERPNRKFTKKINLPYPIMIDHIQSELIDGIFTMVVPIDREEMEDIPISFGDLSPE